MTKKWANVQKLNGCCTIPSPSLMEEVVMVQFNSSKFPKDWSTFISSGESHGPGSGSKAAGGCNTSKSQSMLMYV